MVPAQTGHPTNLEVVIEAVSAGTIPTDQNGTQNPMARVIREVSSSSLTDVSRVNRNERCRLPYTDLQNIYANIPESNMVPAQSAHPTNSEVVIDALPAEAIPKDGDHTQPYVCGTVQEVSRSSVHARTDENENPHLYGAVLRHMMHGPCGKLNPSNVCFFIDGPGGTGKTFLYRALLATIRSARNIALATATSGVAASILPSGRTAHSRFKIPLERDGKLTCNVGKQTGLAKLLRATSLIIWDEASMAKRQIVEALDNMLRDITEVDSLFGGKVVVLGGDFRQVLPVIPKGTKEDCIDASLVRSYIWPYLKKFTLKENMRARTDPAFSSYLLRVGNGEEPCNSNDEITIPSSMIIPPNQKIAPIEQLIAFVFPDLRRYSVDAISMTQSAILAPRNDSVDQTNELLINRFPGKEYMYTSIDETVNPADQGLYVDFMHSVCPPGLPAHRLVLKENCPVMMLRNLDPSKGLCNGTRLICRKLHKHVIMAEIAIGEHQGDIVFIPRISLQPADAKLYPVHFTRRQFPIRLCFAMTINKAQG